MKTIRIAALALMVAVFACKKSDKPADETENVTPVAANESLTDEHDYLDSLYLELNNSPMQQKLRSIKPFPVSVVYYQQRDHNIDSIRKVFKQIKADGFQGLKQVQIKQPDFTPEFEMEVFNAALDEGIIPWYYGMGGWAPIDQPLLDRLGIKLELNDANMPAIQKDPKILAYQDSIFRARVKRIGEPKPRDEYKMGEPGRNSPFITERLVPIYAKWLESKYGTIDSLHKAYNRGYTNNNKYANFEEAAKSMQATGVDQFGYRIGNMKGWDFRAMRDAWRFQADLTITDYQNAMKAQVAYDPYEPERTGGHQLFENQAVNGWDLEGQAKAASIGGSFYASIHLAHHFFLVDGENVRPVIMQARLVADAFKGGWAATWESTGGPTQWSGMDGYTLEGSTVRQMMLSYIAAGLKGIGFWTYNSRDVGWEFGEYALTNLQGKPNDRVKAAGQIAQVLQDQRFELWETYDRPVVGILYSWENEAMLGRLSLGSYPLETPVYRTMRDRMFRQNYSEARIGLTRALLNNNIPYENVSERDLEAGLAKRYKIIYLPYMLALPQKTIELLQKYVAEGGRIVADAPCMYIDDYGRMNKYFAGTPFVNLFGVQINDYFVTKNYKLMLNDMPIEGQFGEVTLMGGSVAHTFADGKPAVINSKFGKGTTTFFNFEATRQVFKPGNSAMEDFIVRNTVGSVKVPYVVEGGKGQVMVMRRAGKKADHYFLVNDGPAATVTITPQVAQYKQITDLLDGQTIEAAASFKVNIAARSGAWIRCEK